MSDLDRLLKLAGREAQQVAQSPAVDREMKEAVGDASEVFYRMQDEFAGGEADGAHKVLIDELVRYLSGDQLEDFVDDFNRHYDLVGDMDESSMSDEEKEKAMKRAMQSADEPERGEKRKKVSVSKAPWESLEEELEDTFVGINTETGDFESGLSHEEVTSGRFTHMLPDDTTYFDPDTAEELVGAPDEEMEAMGWEKVMPKLNDDADRLRKLAGLSVESEELEESSCGCCGNDPCDCASDCGCKTESVNEAPTMDTTQMVIMMKNAGLSEEAIQTKLTEWANSPADASELEQTSHGEAYDFAQNVNLSLKRYLDAQDMKVQVSEHTVENMKSLYESKKNK